MGKTSDRRDKIYKYIVNRLSVGGSPTVKEISEDLSIPSTSTVHGDLNYLFKEGLIEKDGGLSRSIRLPGSGSLQVPLIGTVRAGEPILAVENIEEYISVALSGKHYDDELFALRVKGDSMEKAAILPGDIVIVENTKTANNGEIVVAMIDDEATVKRFYKENDGFRLQPENDSYKPIFAKKVDVLGKVICIYRFL